MRKSRAALVAASVAISALVAACSSSGTSQPSSVPGGASSPTGAQIPLGVIGTFSGPESPLEAPDKLAIEAWADSVNASGGINGHPVHLYVEDDAGSASTSLTEVKSLVQQDHVVAIVGEASSSAAPFAPYLQAEGIPIVGGNDNDLVALTDPDFYSAGGNLLSGYYGITQLAKDDGPKMGNLYCAEIPACASTTALFEAFGKPLGLAVSYSSKVAVSAPDYTAPCQGLISAGVQSYSLGLESTTLKQVIDQCVQQGLKVPMVIPNVADSTYPSNPSFNGMQIVDTVFPFFASSTPATRAFQAAMKKYAPTLGTAAAPMTTFGPQAWVSGKLLEAAIAAAGSGPVTSASIKRGLYALKGDTLGGLTMPLSFTPGKPALHNCYFIYAIKNGYFVEPNGIAPTCVEGTMIDAVAAKLG
jgi:branched-chain amino acid transport system substrate-binding protein